MVFDPDGKRRLFRSVMYGQFFTVEADLERGFDYTFLAATIVNRWPKPHLRMHNGYSLKLIAPTPNAYMQVCEVCSGIGLMGEGLESCGASVMCSNELREPYCDLQRLQGRMSVIQGDIHEPATTKRLHEQLPGPAVVTVGFSCQPWSKLGDSAKMGDE